MTVRETGANVGARQRSAVWLHTAKPTNASPQAAERDGPRTRNILSKCPLTQEEGVGGGLFPKVVFLSKRCCASEDEASL